MVRQRSDSFASGRRDLILDHFIFSIIGCSRSRDREGELWLFVGGSQGSDYRCDDGGTGVGQQEPAVHPGEAD